jgi:hypothetical protein
MQGLAQGMCRAGGLAACLAVLAAAPAAASPRQESIFQDDPLVVFHSSQQSLDQTMRTLWFLGVDRIRVPVFWHEIAPRPGSRRKPRFRRGEASPRSYSASRWGRYDRVVKSAAARGIGVLFTISGSTPIWARSGSRRHPTPFPRRGDLKAFTRAVGTRYSGSYPDPAGGTLPRVDHWSIWNEPNFLQFDYRALLRKRGGARTRPMPPAVYRGVVDAVYSALARTGHRSDTILLGETAPRRGGRRDPNGTIAPVDFLRGVYCVNARYRPLRSCRRGFRRKHPGLFRSAGWAHHPYTVNAGPDWDDRFHKAVPIAGLPRLVSALDRASFRWGSSARLPVWVTEYGIQTNPPDVNLKISWAKQADWLARSDQMLFDNPRVASAAWFLLMDDAPRKGVKGKRRWVTWQSGLATRGGKLKPSYTEYATPIQVRPARAGRPMRVWGQYRSAPDGTALPARVEFQAPGGAWQPLLSQTVTDPKGYLNVRVTAPSAGFVRIVWTDPRFGAEVATRAVRVR